MKLATYWFKLVRILSAKICEFCLIILVDISVLWTAFDELKCLIFLDICLLSTVENEKLVVLLLWHFSYFKLLSVVEIYSFYISL